MLNTVKLANLAVLNTTALRSIGYPRIRRCEVRTHLSLLRDLGLLDIVCKSNFLLYLVLLYPLYTCYL